ncbi:uncharacterized protein BJX67DRAFT_348478 [Aspergillus lucknowensis]|uniref:Uncharacterized protein n=1 Tax=Aspergillus lucknowensis TaxID=176173 RepID=A0ABR4M0A8_9EURO
MEGIAALLAQHSHRICRVQHLRLAVKSSPTRSSAELQALVNLPQSLALFSIRWDHNLDDGEPAPEISVADVWDALQKHRESLEQLAVLYNAHELDEPTPGHFGSLQTFPYLKRLDIQLEVLLDGMTTERLAPFRLKDTIPDSLDCLFLYPGWVYEVGANFLATELQAMVAGRSRPLKVLALDGALAFPYNCEETGGFVDMPPANSGPYSRLWTLCKQAGTQLHVSAGCNDSSIYGRCEFHEGGTCGWVWRKTWTIRGDGIRRSSTRVERLPKPVPWENQIKTRTMALHAVPFTDHMGNEAFMVFKNGIDTEFSTLPPLFPFAVYFSHPGAIPSPDESDLVGLFIDIREGGLSSDFHFRLDVYFLPGASEVDCKTHYLAERASRADYETIIREFEDRTLQLSGQGVSCDSSHAQTTTRLPGMARSHPGLEPYRGLLLLCAQPVWRDGAERISCVLFDKLAVEDTTNEGEGDVHNDAYHNAPESTTRSFRIAYDSPKSGDDDEETIGRWLRHSTKDIQSAHEYEDLHSMAAGMGWTSW